MQKIIVLSITALIALTILASIASSCAAQRQAQATIEVAKSAQIASAGQSISTVVIGCVVFFLVCAFAVIGFLSFRVSRLQQQLTMAGQSGWLPGGGQRVNGQWLPGGGRFNGMPLQDPNQQLAQMMLLQMLQQQNQQQPQAPLALPASTDQNDPWRW